ncbi:Alpha/beta hydrolase of uncharacterised function (DUF1023) [Mycobacteroides abscessus]|nr:Alpha/beta hydrolase of uncharacterised function (DUF1023) [Mycobacteroides abscessus]
MSLPLADIKRAKVQSFRDVADALDGMAGANRDMKRGVERLPIMGDGWKGVSGEAAHQDLDAHGKYLDGHAQAQQSAAAKIRAAADEFEGVQQLLKKLENDAAQGKFAINYDTGEVTPPSGKYDKNELDYLTNTLRQISAAGGVANADLEAAVKAPQTLPDPSGAVAQGLPAMPGSAIKPGGLAAGLEHLAAPDPNADPGATKAAAAAGADTQANYKEWYPKTPGSGDKLTIDPSKAGSFTGTVGALEKLPGAPKPADGFGSGVARQFGQGVNSRVDGLIDEAKNLTGQGGPGSPGVAESWAKFALGPPIRWPTHSGPCPARSKRQSTIPRDSQARNCSTCPRSPPPVHSAAKPQPEHAASSATSPAQKHAHSPTTSPTHTTGQPRSIIHHPTWTTRRQAATIPVGLAETMRQLSITTLL